MSIRIRPQIYLLKLRTHFDAAHNLPKYEGACHNLHGHTWKVEFGFEFPHTDPYTEMCIDFKELKQIIRQVTNYYDHNYINALPEFVKLSSTAENLAKVIFNQMLTAFVPLCEKLKIDGKIAYVEVFESDDASVMYFPTVIDNAGK